MKSTGLPIICDTCGQPILSHGDAWVEWTDKDGIIENIHIVHTPSSSPHKDCYQLTMHPNRSDLPLETILNDRHVELKNKLGLI